MRVRTTAATIVGAAVGLASAGFVYAAAADGPGAAAPQLASVSGSTVQVVRAAPKAAVRPTCGHGSRLQDGMCVVVVDQAVVVAAAPAATALRSARPASVSRGSTAVRDEGEATEREDATADDEQAGDQGEHATDDGEHADDQGEDHADDGEHADADGAEDGAEDEAEDGAENEAGHGDEGEDGDDGGQENGAATQGTDG